MKDHKILIVDDEIVSLRMTDNILSSEYTTICAASGKEAISIIEKDQPDLILSDLRMPEIDGFKLRLMVQEEMGMNIPFMFMTADKKDETESKGFSMGALDYIRKPFRADVLLKRVANYGKNSTMIILIKTEAGDIKVVTDRIENKWESNEFSKKASLPMRWTEFRGNSNC